MIASLFLARRFLLSTTNRTLTIMVRVCFFSIFVSSCAFALTLAIMQGFEDATYSKMKGVHADIYLQAPAGQSFDKQCIAPVLTSEFPEVDAFTGYRYGQGLLIAEDTADAALMSPAMLIGIDPANEPLVTELFKTVENYQSNKPAVHEKHILVGKKRLGELGLQVGDQAWLLTPASTKGLSIELEKNPVVIGGVYSTGFEEIDDRIVYVDDAYLQTFVDQPLSTLGLALKPGTFSTPQLLENLKKRFSSNAITWIQLNPAILSALTLEKYVMGFVAFLIAFIASMNVVALLFMFVTHKKNDIAILRAMGMSARALLLSFVSIALYITITATLLGLLFAAIIAWLLETYKLISLPDVYYVAHVPASFSWGLALLTLCMAIVLAIGASWIALSRLGKQSIAWLLTTIHE